MKSAAFVGLARYMSKSKKNSARQTDEKPIGPVYSDKNGNVIVRVLAKPNAKSNGVTGIEEEGVGIQISVRPVDGEANSELVKYVTSILGLKKNEISLDKGMKSRQKVLLISKKDFTPEEVIAKLREQIKEQM